MAAAILLLAAGCANEAASPDDSTAPPTAPSPSSSTSADPAATACDKVIAGINDFNAGDFEGTVEHFRAAVPLAEAENDGSQEATLLLMAVQYYADLAPEDYPEAARSSDDFARWKAVTLGQCTDGNPIQPPSEEESALIA